ncbi:Transcription factor iws1 [Blyttiomyces sp. JEL0837]|nr:Transcription factor iws1 [Blyttiomyces sp. JEL0837]
MSERGDSAQNREDTPAEPKTANKNASSMNMRGSKENLRGSKQDLSGGLSSKHGSLRNLASKAAPVAAPPPPADLAPPTNALVYENTYKLKPDRKFKSEIVHRIAEEVLANTLTKVKYDAEKTPELSKVIANQILEAVKKQDFDRYKLVVDVTIGEFKGQGIKVASRALWDTTTDSYASASFRNASLFAVAIPCQLSQTWLPLILASKLDHHLPTTNMSPPAPTYEDIFGSDESDSEINNKEVLSDSDDESPQKKQSPPRQRSPEPTTGEAEESEPSADKDKTEKSESAASAPSLPKFKKKNLDSTGDGSSGSKSKPKKSSKKRKDRPADDGDGEIRDDDEDKPQEEESEAARDFNAALERIKNKRRKKLDGDDTTIDEMIQEIVDKMKEAAHTDQEFNQQRQPAVAKMKLLAAVTSQLAKSPIYEQFLDNNILEAMKLWLEPLRRDGSLPSLDVQWAMFTTLQKMPITTIHLRESRIGRVVMFYTKCERVVPSIKKIANELLDKWMRPILGRSKNYRERSYTKVDYTVKPKESEGRISMGDKPDESARTVIPKPVQLGFDIQPKSKIDWDEEKGKSGQDLLFKKIKNRFQMLKRKDKGPPKM